MISSGNTFAVIDVGKIGGAQNCRDLFDGLEIRIPGLSVEFFYGLI